MCRCLSDYPLHSFFSFTHVQAPTTTSSHLDFAKLFGSFTRAPVEVRPLAVLPTPPAAQPLQWDKCAARERMLKSLRYFAHSHSLIHSSLTHSVVRSFTRSLSLTHTHSTHSLFHFPIVHSFALSLSPHLTQASLDSEDHTAGLLSLFCV